MKKLLGAAILFLSLTGAAFAQVSNDRYVKITDDQVPLVVKQAYEKDFGAIPAEGYWTVRVSTSMKGTRTIATPLWYCFKKRDKKEKIEVRISPEGAVTLAKGLTRSGAAGEQGQGASDSN